MKKAILVTALTLGIGSLAFASTVSLYSQPDSNSNVIAQVDNQQVKPFFTKDGWVKVGDINTGETGWIMASETPQGQAQQAQIEKQLSGLENAKQAARQAKANFDADYQNTMNTITAKQQTLENQLTQNKDTNDTMTLISTQVSYSGNGQDGKVHITESWTNKDGKVESKTFDLPVKQYEQQIASQTQNIYQQMQ